MGQVHLDPEESRQTASLLLTQLHGSPEGGWRDCNDVRTLLQSIRDTDFAEETARLTRAQILVQSGSSVLQISNQNPQNILALLPK